MPAGCTSYEAPQRVLMKMGSFLSFSILYIPFRPVLPHLRQHHMVHPPQQKPETVRAPIGADQCLRPSPAEKPVLPPADSILNAIKLRNAPTDYVFGSGGCTQSGIPELCPETILRVKQSVPFLRSHGTAIMTRFYTLLFERYPGVRRHFNMDRQARGAAGAAGVPAQVGAMSRQILMYAGHIDHPEKLVGAITKIAEKHVARSVKNEQYGYIGECFLTALQEVLAPDESILEAWRCAYEKLAAIFQKIERDITDKSTRAAGYTADGIDVTIQRITQARDKTKARSAPKDRIFAVRYPDTMAMRPQIRKGQFLAIKLKDVPGGIGDTMLTATVTIPITPQDPASSCDTLYFDCNSNGGGLVHLRIQANGDRANAYLIATAKVGDVLSVGLPVGAGEDGKQRKFP